MNLERYVYEPNDCNTFDVRNTATGEIHGPFLSSSGAKRAAEDLEMLWLRDCRRDLLRGCQAAAAYLCDPASEFASNREEAARIIRAAIDAATTPPST